MLKLLLVFFIATLLCMDTAFGEDYSLSSTRNDATLGISYAFTTFEYLGLRETNADSRGASLES